MKKPKEYIKETDQKLKQEAIKPNDNGHLGSSNAFEETENPLSKDPDNISDERLDELLGE